VTEEGEIEDSDIIVDDVSAEEKLRQEAYANMFAHGLARTHASNKPQNPLSKKRAPVFECDIEHCYQQLGWDKARIDAERKKIDANVTQYGPAFNILKLKEEPLPTDNAPRCCDICKIKAPMDGVKHAAGCLLTRSYSLVTSPCMCILILCL
jgi:hypothetical protein